MSLDRVEHESLEIGAAPIIRTFLERLQLAGLLENVPSRKPLGRGPKLAASRVIAAMITNILIARRPLYGLRDWVGRFVPEHFGLEAAEVDLLNDDRLGRALDRMFEADRASMMTAVITRAVRLFEIDVKQLHSDTTTVTFPATTRRPPRRWPTTRAARR